VEVITLTEEIMKIVAIFISIFLFNLNLFSLDIGIEVTTGTHVFKNEATDSSTKASIYGIRNNIYFNKNIAIQLKYENIQSTKNNENLQRYTTSIMYQVKLLYKTFVPYFLMGIGYESGEKKSNYYDYGMGGKYYFTNNTSFLTQLDVIKKIDKKPTYGFSLGLGYDFNKAPTNKLGKIDYKKVDVNIMQNLSNQKDSDEIFLTPY
jgi:hypothetical protein